MVYQRVTLFYLSVLIFSALNIIFLVHMHLHVGDLTEIKRNNASILTLVILISNNILLQAAQDTWILECPFEVFICSWCNNSTQLNDEATRSLPVNQYLISVDVAFYVEINKVQKLIIEGYFHRYCSTTNQNRICQSLPNSVLIGPLETPRDFYRIQARFNSNSRRPIQDPLGYDPFIDPQCVHNPVIQLETYPTFDLPECPSPSLPRIPIELVDLPVYMITLKKDNDRDNKIQKASLVNMYRSHGLHVNPFFGVKYTEPLNTSNADNKNLTAGERGLRETMRRFITHIDQIMQNLVLVFEDDVMPHKNFGLLLRRLLTTQSPDRCSSHLLDGPEAGGILLLGASVWSYKKTGWNMIDKDIKSHSNGSSCFNADLATYGAYAVLMHRTTFRPILNWLDNPSFAHLPYDHVFKDLGRRGHIVRVAYPFLAIPDVSHVSLVNPYRDPKNRNSTWRSRLHRWTPLNDYFSLIQTSEESSI